MMDCVNAVRIVNSDFYMSSPIQDLDVMYSDFRGSSIAQVPIIRIFGSSNTGKKICLHIHGVFPYLYIPYDGKEEANRLQYQIAINIDRAINISFGKAQSTAQHVYKVSLVSGIPFYGYHAREHQFFKIYLYNPSLVRKVANLLENEAVLGKIYQPHEIHINFIMQFMIDYNLHGMSNVVLSEIKYRMDLNNPPTDTTNYLPASISKTSVCELEGDTLSQNILNRLEINTGNIGVNPGIAALWDDERQRRRNKNEDSQIGPCLTLTPTNNPPTTSHTIFKQALAEKLALASSNSEKIDQNASVYAAETPNEKSVMNASLLDFHSPFNSQTFNESLDLDGTLDEEGQNLLEILQELEGQVDDKEEDCILSQIQMEEDEDDLDLSLPMAVNTPFKIIPEEDESEDLYNSSLDKTLVPQLDGHFDEDSDEDYPKKRSSSKKKASKYSALPISVSTPRSNATVAEDTVSESYAHVKRQLSFSLNETIIACKFKSHKKEEIANCSKAEKYDIENHFIPKEGCSKNLTQSTETNSQNPISDIEQSFSQETEDIEIKKAKPPPPEGYWIIPLYKAPTKKDILSTLEKYQIPEVVYNHPYYSKVSDVTGGVEVGHSLLKINTKTTAHAEDFNTFYKGLDTHRRLLTPDVKWTHENIKGVKLSYCDGSYCTITPVKRPPSVKSVRNWKSASTPKRQSDIKPEKTKIYLPSSPGAMDQSELELTLTLSPEAEEDNNKIKRTHEDSGQIIGMSLDNSYGFQITPENYQEARAVTECQYLTILSMEVHCCTRGDLRPDPTYDQIEAIFYSLTSDTGAFQEWGIIAVKESLEGVSLECEIKCVDNELELVKEFTNLILKNNPDIFAGFEIEMQSWGYLQDRCRILGLNLPLLLSRIKDRPVRVSDEDKGQFTGRIVLDVWRLLRHEIALQSYTFENMVYHILHRRVPQYSFKDLTIWWNNTIHRHRVVKYYMFRAGAYLQIMEQLDLIGRTSELARLFGIQFYEVLSRGSQFRVESMMLRLAKPLNYIPVSPSVQQRAHMKAPEFLPLILEPESKFYVDPVIVLDFQSLYPSIIIAYNYCFSTCIGKVLHLGKNGPFEFGATQLKISKARTEKLLQNDCLNFSPCGVAFVKSNIRDGILPRMLREILDTRLMVKGSMKQNKNDPVLQKVLHSRQLGLKLIANVTYGYTAANFSGRMPAVELGDSVVSKGRETLQRAIALVDGTPEWGARVVYGDTDSLFVLVPGKSRSEAFEVGRKIADAVTADNPNPVKLKLEKVYQPCILQTKKRYVGYMYESREEEEPTYQAKGIETVRRDGCPAVAKMLEKCLRVLFDTRDVSLVKEYVLKQFHKILSGRVSLQDLTFAKEYRGMAGYRPGACVPALELARKWTAVDKRREPRSGERVPYVIANGPPGLPLIRLVHSPTDFLNEVSLRPNAFYYITKVIIPPINRCFKLIGADLNLWFNQMPRKHYHVLPTSSPGRKCTISQYFSTNSCPSCGEQTQKTVCDKCRSLPLDTIVTLHEKIHSWERSHWDIRQICQSCTEILDRTVCTSLDCPVLYKAHQTSRDLQQAQFVRDVINALEF